MKRTVQGRVVYDRKHHGFEAKDVVRVLKALDLADYTRDSRGFRALLEIYFQAWGLTVQGLMVMLVKEPDEAGTIIIKIITEFFKALTGFFKAGPGYIKLLILDTFNRLLLKGKE